MAFDPDYGETLVDDEEREALTDNARDLLGQPARRADLYDLEQALQVQVTEELLTAVLDETIGLDDLLRDHFVRALHHRLYGDIWTWAGRFRARETNIGIAPEMIAIELRSTLDDIRHRWEHTNDLTPRQLGIAVHAAAVRIHPFVDGNGRTTRLLADLAFVAAQDGPELEQYDWELDKAAYIRLLRKYDRSRDPSSLAAFIAVRSAER